MRNVGTLVSVVGGLVFSFAMYPAFGHDQREAEFDEQAALDFSQAAVGKQVGNYKLSNGHDVRLDDFHGRPILVNLVYTSCYHTCPTLTNHLASTVRIALDALGADSFSVLTIGFDATHDTPERMQQFAKDRGIDISNWKFLSADHRTIDALSQDLGFRYFASPKGLDHTIQTTILDGDGRVFRQVYGSSFDAPQLVEPLKELVFGVRANSTSVSGWRLTQSLQVVVSAAGNQQADQGEETGRAHRVGSVGRSRRAACSDGLVTATFRWAGSRREAAPAAVRPGRTACRGRWGRGPGRARPRGPRRARDQTGRLPCGWNKDPFRSLRLGQRQLYSFACRG